MPLVGTFHCYSTQRALQRRSPPTWPARAGSTTSCTCAIAVSEAARWTGERFYGGRYRIVPNGVDLAAAPARRARRREAARAAVRRPRRGAQGPARAAARLRGAARRRGRRAADRGGRHRGGGRAAAARPRGRARAGPRDRGGEVARCWARPTCCARRRWAARASAWCSPRRSRPRTPGGGLGHRRLPRRGARRRRRPARARRRSRRAGRGPARAGARPRAPRDAMAAAARERAERFAWPHVADEVLEAYEDAVEMPGARAPRAQRAAARLGLAPPRTGPPLAARAGCRRSSPRRRRTRRRTAVRVARAGRPCSAPAPAASAWPRWRSSTSASSRSAARWSRPRRSGCSPPSR